MMLFKKNESRLIFWREPEGRRKERFFFYYYWRPAEGTGRAARSKDAAEAGHPLGPYRF